jgi:D-alanyl-D-alanine carboxypeptidase
MRWLRPWAYGLTIMPTRPSGGGGGDRSPAGPDAASSTSPTSLTSPTSDTVTPQPSVRHGAPLRSAPTEPVDGRRARRLRPSWHLRPSRPSPRLAGAAATFVAGIVLVAGLLAIGGGSPSPVAMAGGTPGPSTGGPSLPASGSPASSPAARPSASDAPSSGGPASPPASPNPPVPGTVVPAERLQATLDALRKKASIPGVSVAILWDDGTSWLGVSGRSDVAGKTPVTTDTAFSLASISKTLTAAVVLQLVDEGRLELSDPVAPWLPAYRLDKRITVRMLLDHTSGLPDFFLNRKIDRALQSAPNATWSPARTWKYVSKSRATPGRTWSYSNTNYLLLGELVEAVTGRPLATEVRTRLLDPLGLEGTWYQAVERPRATISVGYRLLAKSGGGVRAVRVAPASTVMPFRSVVTAAGGAGSVAATALDTARWMQAFARGEVMSPATYRAMLADAATTRALKARVPYGLGIQVVSIGGHAALGHSGRFLGFRGVVRYLPDDGVTIAVLTNQGVADPAKIVAALLKVVLPQPAVGPPSQSATPVLSATPVPATTPHP